MAYSAMEITRRRRKSSFAALYKSIILDTSEVESQTEPSTTSREEIIKNHVSIWNDEKENWKKKSHQLKLEHVTKIRETNPIITWKDCKELLTAEDRAFLKSKTTCDELVQKLKNVEEKKEIIECVLEKTDTKVKASYKKKCASVLNMKKKVCNSLLMCDEGNDMLEFDDDMM